MLKIFDKSGEFLGTLVDNFNGNPLIALNITEEMFEGVITPDEVLRSVSPLVGSGGFFKRAQPEAVIDRLRSWWNSNYPLIEFNTQRALFTLLFKEGKINDLFLVNKLRPKHLILVSKETLDKPDLRVDFEKSDIPLPPMELPFSVICSRIAYYPQIRISKILINLVSIPYYDTYLICKSGDVTIDIKIDCPVKTSINQEIFMEPTGHATIGKVVTDGIIYLKEGYNFVNPFLPEDEFIFHRKTIEMS